MEPKQDFKLEWLNLIRRMQGGVSRNNGYALMTITVLVGPKNVPVAWGPPELKCIEPRESAGDTLMNVVKLLCQAG